MALPGITSSAKEGPEQALIGSITRSRRKARREEGLGEQTARTQLGSAGPLSLFRCAASVKAASGGAHSSCPTKQGGRVADERRWRPNPDHVQPGRGPGSLSQRRLCRKLCLHSPVTVVASRPARIRGEVVPCPAPVADCAQGGRAAALRSIALQSHCTYEGVPGNLRVNSACVKRCADRP